MRIQSHRLSVLQGRSIAALCALVVLGACDRGVGARGDTANAEQPAVSHLLVAGDSLRFVQHDENLPVGFPASVKPLLIKNPYEGDKAAISTGAKLFVAYNCLDCHGADGSGAMGPSFQDGRWHFGGAPGEGFESIYQGRPDGMPA